MFKGPFFSKISQAVLGLTVLSSTVFAETTPVPVPGAVGQPQPSMLSNFFPLILIVIIVVFFFWSQRRKTTQMNKMLSALSEGDEIIMTNGFMGKIAKMGDQAITVEISEGVKVKVQKNAVLQVLPKGTLSSF